MSGCAGNNNDMMQNAAEKSRIAEFFDNGSVFITGATGFIGKLIVLKLLRSCHRTCHVYVLIREKKGKTAAERLGDILDAEPFQRFFLERPDARERVTAISGDIILPDLGVSRIDYEHLCKHVSVVVHGAASVRFDESIAKAMETNVKGLLNLLQLAGRMNNLQSFVYISTAYSNCNRAKIEEVIYPTSITPLNAMECLANLAEDDFLAFAQKLLEGRPNTYTFTKALAEQLVHLYRHDIPLCIVRPSVVSPAQRDPSAGWVDNWNGATGGCGLTLHGFLHFVPVGPEFSTLDFIPVDHVVNLVIAAAWFTATASNERMDPYFIYNCCSGGSNPASLEMVVALCEQAAWKTPFSKTLWYPSLTFVKNKWVYRSCDLLFHRLPCEFADLLAKFFGRKQIMMKAYRKMTKTLDLLSFFLQFDFDFSIENTKKLYKQLSPADKQTFFFDVDAINWENYLHGTVAGIRKHLLHEPEAQLENDRARFKRLYVVHCVFRGFVALILLTLLYVLSYNLY